MGKAGRMACIFVPMVLTIICLVFLTIIGLGQTNAGSTYLSNLYFLRADTMYKRSTVSDALLNHKANNETDSHDKDSSGDIVIYKYYTVGLWNYCAGNGTSADHSDAEIGQNSSYKVDFCTARDIHFTFDPEKVWGLSSTVTSKLFSKTLNSWLDKYTNALGKAIGPVYIIAVCATGLEFLIGIGAIFSRIGGFCTWISALLAGILSFGFAVLVTASYFTLSKAFNAALDKDGVHMDTGRTLYIYAWLVVAFQTAATTFWAFTSCCVSGRSSDRGQKGIRMVDTPFHSSGAGGYQKMEGGEALMGHGAPMGHDAHHGHTGYAGGDHGTAYEPYRHH